MPEPIFKYTENTFQGSRDSMDSQILAYMQILDEDMERIREMVVESCRDIAAGKGRDCNRFFDELEKRYADDRG